MSQNHPLSARGELSMADLRHERFVVMSRSYSSRGYDAMISKARMAGYDPSIIATAASVPHLMTLLASGEYVTILSENYRHMAWNRLSFVPLSGVNMTDFYFMWDTTNSNPCVKLMAEYVWNVFRHLQTPELPKL